MIQRSKYNRYSAILMTLGAMCSTVACQQQPAATPASGSSVTTQVTAIAATDGPATLPAPSYQAIVDATDRTPDDRALDAGRHPVELLQFLDVRPGMIVAEIGAGFGYTAELLARTVSTGGRVYAQNTPFVISRFAEKPWSERLKKPVMSNVIRVDRNYDDPLPPEAKNLDLVLINLIYHDTVWMQTDRARMNRVIFAALRSGGAYVVIDHSGRSGTGATETSSLHRIEEQTLRNEVQLAGFVLAAEAGFLRNPMDARDWNTAPRAAGEKRGTSDRFVLKFVKP